MDKAPRERLLSTGFVLAWIANFMHSTSLHSYVHFPGFLKGLGAGEFVIGVVVGTMSVAAIAARPSIGWLMDHRGRRIVMIAGGIVHVCAGLLYLTVADLGPWVFLVRLVHGVAQGSLFSVLFTYASDIIPVSRRAEGIALFGVSGMVPLGIGGLLGDFVVVDGNYDPLFLTSAGCALAGLMASLPLPETRPAGVPRRRTFVAAALAPELLPLWFIGLSFSTSLAGYFTFLKTYVQVIGAGSAGHFFTSYAASAVLLRAFFAWLPERVGLKRVLYPALCMSMVGLVTLAYATTAVHIVVAGISCGIGHGFAFPIISTLVVNRARNEERGSAVSLFTALFDFGTLVGGPTFGLVIRFTNYTVMFWTAAALQGTALVVFALWEARRGSETRDDARPPVVRKPHP